MPNPNPKPLALAQNPEPEQRLQVVPGITPPGLREAVAEAEAPWLRLQGLRVYSEPQKVGNRNKDN